MRFSPDETRPPARAPTAERGARQPTAGRARDVDRRNFVCSPLGVRLPSYAVLWWIVCFSNILKQINLFGLVNRGRMISRTTPT